MLHVDDVTYWVVDDVIYWVVDEQVGSIMAAWSIAHGQNDQKIKGSHSDLMAVLLLTQKPWLFSVNYLFSR